jgi:hypothetical protein
MIKQRAVVTHSLEASSQLNHCAGNKRRNGKGSSAHSCACQQSNNPGQ